MTERPIGQVIGCGLVMLVGLVLLAVGLLAAGAGGGWFRDRVEVAVDLPDAVGLPDRGVVAVAGVQVGEVVRREVVDGRARVTLALDPAAGLRKDVTVRVRSESVLGKKYVELAPVSPDAPLLVDGDVLEPGPDQTEIDEIVDALGPVVAAVDPEALGLALGALTDALRDDPARLRRMLDNADRALQNGADASEGLAQAVVEGRSTLARANQTLSALDARIAQAGGVLDHADALIAELDAAAEPLPGTVAKADAALDDLRAAIQPVAGATEDLAKLLAAFEDFDEDAIHRVLREDGVRIHLFGDGKKNRSEDP